MQTMTAQKGNPKPGKWARRDEVLTHLAYLGMAFIIGWGACSINYQVSNMPKLWNSAHALHTLQSQELPALKQKIRRCQFENS
jgi:hypothetical protein